MPLISGCQPFVPIMVALEKYLRTITAGAAAAAGPAPGGGAPTAATLAAQPVHTAAGTQSQEKAETVSSLAGPPPPPIVIDTARILMNVIQTISQLAGWEHVSQYVVNPQLYIERTKAGTATRSARTTLGPVSSDASSAATTGAVRGGTGNPTVTVAPKLDSNGKVIMTEVPTDIELMSERGQTVFKKLMRRLEWFDSLRESAAKSVDSKAGGAAAYDTKEFDAKTCVEMLALDKEWCDDAIAFIKESESKVTSLLEKHPQKFNQFRELQRKGVQWPHSAELRREIERAGFSYRPSTYTPATS
jgi:hypothetical protein